MMRWIWPLARYYLTLFDRNHSHQSMDKSNAWEAYGMDRSLVVDLQNRFNATFISDV